MMHARGLRRALLAGGALAAAIPVCAAAQDPAGDGPVLEEIVVTARKREENLQTTPVAITALSAEALEARNVIALDKVAEIAPSLHVNETPGALGTASSTCAASASATSAWARTHRSASTSTASTTAAPTSP